LDTIVILFGMKVYFADRGNKKGPAKARPFIFLLPKVL